MLIKQRKQINKNAFIYVRTQGGGVKRLFRFLDLYGTLNLYIPSLFLTYIYDPCRNAFLGLFLYLNGIISYRIGTEDLDIFSIYFPIMEDSSLIRAGQVTFLKNLKGGSVVHSVPLILNHKSTLARSAGMFVYLLRNDLVNRLSFLRIKRGLTLILDFNTLVTLGKICNSHFIDIKKGKAGLRRLLGYRPVVRGIAMNPVDHPNGGRTPGGKVYRSFSNRIARSQLKTRKRSRFYNRFIVLN